MSNTIVVTGCSSGIGAATAQLLQQQGIRVIGLDLHDPSANVDEFIRIDLSDYESIDAAVDAVVQPVNGLCNIAGVPPTVPAEIQIRVNFLGLKYFTEKMTSKLAHNASIVNLASSVGMQWQQNIDLIRQLIELDKTENLLGFLEANNVGGEAAYAFSKQAVNAWTTMAAQQWYERGITIKSVCPGPIKTPILDDFLQTIVKQQVQLPEEYLGNADDIAAMVCFLCQESGRWVNGSSILIDGGLGAFRFNKNE